MLTRLSEGLRKNAPELQALLAGQMPAFILGRRRSAVWQVPVFVLHEVTPDRFERQLQFLRSNGYWTLDAEELAEARRGRRGAEGAVALTFDDATWTFWAFAFPMLRHYGFKAILFAIPGLIPDDHQCYPNLDDVAAGRCSQSDLYRRATTQPMCTWNELAALHASGVVDVQSHSVTHARVPISPRPIDFLRPDFDTYWFGNVNVPLSVLDDPSRPERRLRLGAPVFPSASRLAGRLRFKEAPEVVMALMDHVEAHGGGAFFRARRWREQLRRIWVMWPKERRGSFETAGEMAAALRFELAHSKQALEARLPGKMVRHFCYPWFEGSPLVDDHAAEAGYHAVHYGMFCPARPRSAAPLRVPRISEEYLLSLPGAGRISSWAVWSRRLRRFARGETSSSALGVPSRPPP